MAIDFLYPQYEVVRNNDRCINCRACERQCANEVHFWDADNNRMQADESKCVACHRCVALCPTRALKIVKTDHTLPPGRLGRRAAVLDGQPGPAPHLLG